MPLRKVCDCPFPLLVVELKHPPAVPPTLTSQNGDLTIDVPGSGNDVYYTSQGSQVFTFNGVAADLASHTSSLGDHENRLNDHDSILGTHSSDISSLQDRASSLETRASQVESDIQQTNDALSSQGTTLTQAVSDSNSQLTTYIDGEVVTINGVLNAHSTTIEQHTAGIALVQSNLDDATTSLQAAITMGDTTSQTATSNVLTELRNAETCALAGQAFDRASSTCKSV
jgi:uncharacterized coiled-coil protein SlyX